MSQTYPKFQIQFSQNIFYIDDLNLIQIVNGKFAFGRIIGGKLHFSPFEVFFLSFMQIVFCLRWMLIYFVNI
jgi:hypothetical protein